MGEIIVWTPYGTHNSCSVQTLKKPTVHLLVTCISESYWNQNWLSTIGLLCLSQYQGINCKWSTIIINATQPHSLFLIGRTFELGRYHNYWNECLFLSFHKQKAKGHSDHSLSKRDFSWETFPLLGARTNRIWQYFSSGLCSSCQAVNLDRKSVV